MISNAIRIKNSKWRLCIYHHRFLEKIYLADIDVLVIQISINLALRKIVQQKEREISCSLPTSLSIRLKEKLVATELYSVFFSAYVTLQLMWLFRKVCLFLASGAGEDDQLNGFDSGSSWTDNGYNGETTHEFPRVSRNYSNKRSETSGDNGDKSGSGEDDGSKSNFHGNEDHGSTNSKFESSLELSKGTSNSKKIYRPF